MNPFGNSYAENAVEILPVISGAQVVLGRMMDLQQVSTCHDCPAHYGSGENPFAVLPYTGMAR